MKFSKYQLDIENETITGSGNIAVEATAGSGKTTVTVKCASSLPKFKKNIFLSFSKAIVDELKERLPDYFKAATLHSLGYGMIRQYYKDLKLDDDRFFKMAMELYPKETRSTNKKAKQVFKECFWIQDVAKFARMTLTPFEVDPLKEMCQYYALDFTKDVLEKTIKLLNDSYKKITTIDFTDMIYLPVRFPHLIGQKYDNVLWDEAQDANNCQITFVELIKKPEGRLIAVGDSQQSIYGFMGSNIDSFAKIKERFNTKEFTLPISYRCPKEVVEFAQGVYDTIQYHEDAIQGSVRVGSVYDIQEGDMVLCRNTLPLVHVYFQLISADIKATIIGKDIESGLIEFAKKVMSDSFQGVEFKMDRELQDLKEELQEIGFAKPEKHNKYRTLIEKIKVISLILHKVNKCNELIPKIHEIFSDTKDAAKLMTIHRSKGLEAKRVFVLESFFGKQLIPSEYADQDWEMVQEKNLEFVAYTRSKSELILFDVDE